MSPTFKERAQWIYDRQLVLDECVRELTRRAAFYRQVAGTDQTVLASTMHQFKTELLALSIELEVLSKVGGNDGRES